MAFMHWTLQTRVCMHSLSKGREERKPDRAGDKGWLNSEHMAVTGGCGWTRYPYTLGGWEGGCQQVPAQRVRVGVDVSPVTSLPFPHCSADFDDEQERKPRPAFN